MTQRAANRRKVLLIGWDSADWKTIHPLMDQGLMPNLQRMVEGGTIGRLATLVPPLSPMLWTSIATGKRPYKHGIIGFTEPTADGGSVRPVTNVHRRVKAIWNMLDQRGLRSHVVGWWPSHPAEPINGVMVSNFFQRAHQPGHLPWPLPEGAVHPPGLREEFAKLRVHPDELTAAHIAPFVPDFALVDQAKVPTLATLSRIIADCAGIQAAATCILDREEWDFMAVYFDGLDHFNHGFMKYHPPRRPFIPESDFQLYKGVVTAAHRFHDLMLGRLMELAGEEATVMLISDHGFHPDRLRPARLPQEPAAPMFEHGPYGILCVKGPGIRKDHMIHGAGLLDITPTLLHLFGLPAGRDMDGKVLQDIREEPQPVELVDTWEEPATTGEPGPLPVGDLHMAAMGPEWVAQLVDLGYIEDPGGDPSQAVPKTIRENRYYLALAYLDGGRTTEAVAELEALHGEAPGQLRYGTSLARAYLRTGRTQDARRVVDEMREADRLRHEGGRQENGRDGNGSGSGMPYSEPARLRLLQARVLQADGAGEQALAQLRMLEKDPLLGERLQYRIAEVLIGMGRWRQAMHALEKFLAFDADSAKGHHALGVCLLKTGDLESALHHLHEAVGLNFNMAMAHYHLAEAYNLAGEHNAAAQAYAVCLHLSPGLNRARQRLAALYKVHLNRPGEAEALLRQVADRCQGGPITVVSGLPRSGTSVMMQALQAGGMEVFADGARPGDESNPKGYFEHKAIKALMHDPGVIVQAQGKAVKVVAPLLPYLPPLYRYRVIMMVRDTREVLRSQNEMIERGRKGAKRAFRTGLQDALDAQVERTHRWIGRNPHVQVLKVDFRDLMSDPEREVRRVCDFLGEQLDVAAMAAAVDPRLYRSRLDGTD
ncbi:MAG TPA: alkaline phosphatase family protein [Flavobacteriales bacterium]|nr:alkaline phosphatase family protein [Flavobacteriales bacterium]HRP81747.1 alkaline phosphatase family protein [Flavobacteriales bacterium]